MQYATSLTIWNNITPTQKSSSIKDMHLCASVNANTCKNFVTQEKNVRVEKKTQHRINVSGKPCLKATTKREQQFSVSKERWTATIMSCVTPFFFVSCLQNISEKEPNTKLGQRTISTTPSKTASWESHTFSAVTNLMYVSNSMNAFVRFLDLHSKPSFSMGDLMLSEQKPKAETFGNASNQENTQDGMTRVSSHSKHSNAEASNAKS